MCNPLPHRARPLVALAQGGAPPPTRDVRQRLAWCRPGARSCATSACGRSPVPHRPPPGPEAATLSSTGAVPQGASGAGRRHPRRRRHGADGRWPASSRSRPTIPARPTTAPAGWADVLQRPGGHDLRRVQRRSSATSSARWCSGCPRNREPKPPPGPSSRRPRSEGAGRRSLWGPLRRKGVAAAVARRPSLWPNRQPARPAASPGSRVAAPTHWAPVPAKGLNPLPNHETQRGPRLDHPIEPDDAVRDHGRRQWAATMPAERASGPAGGSRVSVERATTPHRGGLHGRA